MQSPCRALINQHDARLFFAACAFINRLLQRGSQEMATDREYGMFKRFPTRVKTLDVLVTWYTLYRGASPHFITHWQLSSLNCLKYTYTACFQSLENNKKLSHEMWNLNLYWVASNFSYIWLLNIWPNIMNKMTRETLTNRSHTQRSTAALLNLPFLFHLCTKKCCSQIQTVLKEKVPDQLHLTDFCLSLQQITQSGHSPVSIISKT